MSWNSEQLTSLAMPFYWFSSARSGGCTRAGGDGGVGAGSTGRAAGVIGLSGAGGVSEWAGLAPAQVGIQGRTGAVASEQEPGQPRMTERC